MRKHFFTVCVFVCMVGLSGCHKSPIDRASNTNGSSLGTFGASGTFPIFSSELRTGGGAFEYPGGENQSLSFEDRSNPLSQRSIRYVWNGNPATGDPMGDHTFAGFTLMNTINLSQYADPSNIGRDLSAGGYHRATFYARGTLTTNTSLKVEVGNNPMECITLSTDGTQDLCNEVGSGDLDVGHGTLSSSWSLYSIPISNPTSMSKIKDFWKATFVFTDPLTGVPGQPAGQGGAAYFDQIQYEH